MVNKTAQPQNEPPLLAEILADLEKDFSSRQQILQQAKEKNVGFISQAISESHAFLQEISHQFSAYVQRLKNIEPDASFLTEFEIYIKDAGATLTTKFRTSERHVLSESEWDRTWHNIDLAFESAFVSNSDELVYEIYSPDAEDSDDSKKVEIHVSEIVARRLSEILPGGGQRAKSLLEQGRIDVSQHVLAAWDAVHSNLEDTQAGLADYSPRKLEALTESLEDSLRRATNRLDDVVLEANRVWDDIKNELQFARDQVLNEVRLEIQEVSTGRTKFIRTSKFLRRIRDGARINWIPGVIVRMITALMNSLKRAVYLPSRLRRVSLKPLQIQTIDEYELIPVEKLHEKLPTTYSNLFSLEPLVKEEFLVARQEEYNILEKALSHWDSGKPCSVLNVGEKGSGKTSLVNCFQKRFFSEFETLRGTIVKKLTAKEELINYISQLFGLSENLTFDQLVEAINAGRKRIVILEGCHNLYLRQLNGFDAFRLFLSLITQTNLEIMWILSIDYYAWRYLARVVPIDTLCFDYVINLQPMEKESIREAILTRHNGSEYRLRYLNDELRNKLKKQFKARRDVTERQLRRIIEDNFFETLFAASHGNISSAILYWLNSVRFTGNDIEINLLKVPELQLSDLSIEQNFALLAIIEHENLTVDELETVLDISHSESSYILSLLRNHHLIIFDENVDKYSISPVMLKPITNMLKDLNLIY